MNARQEISAARLNRVAKFGEENASILLPEKPKMGPSVGQQILSELSLLLGEIRKAHTVQESGGSQEDTQEKAELRTALREQLREISQSVRFIAVKRNTPAIKKRFKIGANSSDQVLIAKALSVCEAIEELELGAELIAMSHAPDFLSALQQSIAAFQSSTQAQSGTIQERAAATADLNALLARGRVLADGLNAIMTKLFKGNPGKLAAWKTAYHLERAARHSIKEAPALPAENESAIVQEAPPPMALGTRPEPAANGR